MLWIWDNNVFVCITAGRTIRSPVFTSWPRALHVAGWSKDCFTFSTSGALCIHTYHVDHNYVMYIIAMQLYFGQLLVAALSTGVPTVSSLAQL